MKYSDFRQTENAKAARTLVPLFLLLVGLFAAMILLLNYM